MKRGWDVDNMIAAKHAKATARTIGAIKVEFTVINEMTANESVTYHCWTENCEDGKANAYINSTCVPSTVRITFIPCDSKEQYQREHPSCKLVITFTKTEASLSTSPSEMETSIDTCPKSQEKIH